MILNLLFFLLFLLPVHAMEEFLSQMTVVRSFPFKDREDDVELIKRTKTIRYEWSTLPRQFNNQISSIKYDNIIYYSNENKKIRFRENIIHLLVNRFLVIEDKQRAEELLIYQHDLISLLGTCRNDLVPPLGSYVPYEFNYIGCSPCESKIIYCSLYMESDYLFKKPKFVCKVFDAQRSMRSKGGNLICETELKNSQSIYAVTVYSDGEHIAYIVKDDKKENSYVVEYKSCKNMDEKLFSESFVFQDSPKIIHFDTSGTKIIVYNEQLSDFRIFQLVKVQNI